MHHEQFLSDPSPIIGYACQWLPPSLPNSLTDSCLVNLMALYDTNCLMMSQTRNSYFMFFYDEKMVGILLNKKQQLLYVFIGPKSDHCLPLSLTHSLTD